MVESRLGGQLCPGQTWPSCYPVVSVKQTDIKRFTFRKISVQHGLKGYLVCVHVFPKSQDGEMAEKGLQCDHTLMGDAFSLCLSLVSAHALWQLK